MSTQTKLVAIALGLWLAPATSSGAYAAAFLADATLSPVKAVLEMVLTPFTLTFAGALATANSPVDRQTLAETVSVDAADHLSGADPTPLLKEVHSTLRKELQRRGDARDYSDQELSAMIVSELAAQ